MLIVSAQSCLAISTSALSALKTCTLSFQQSTLSIMQGTLLLSAHLMLRVLRVNDFADVTLACVDGQQVRAHKALKRSYILARVLLTFGT